MFLGWYEQGENFVLFAFFIYHLLFTSRCERFGAKRM